MRSKNIFGLITFFAAFAFSAFIALLFAAPKLYEVPPVNYTYEVRTFNHKRCGKAQKIEEFLKQDKRNGLIRKDSGETDSDDVAKLAKRAELTSKYAFISNAMNAGEFPRDFQIAWNQHMDAWRNYADFLKKESGKQMISEDFEELESEKVSEINSTWQEVLSIGREYGADLPAGF